MSHNNRGHILCRPLEVILQRRRLYNTTNNILDYIRLVTLQSYRLDMAIVRRDTCRLGIVSESRAHNTGNYITVISVCVYGVQVMHAIVEEPSQVIILIT